MGSRRSTREVLAGLLAGYQQGTDGGRTGLLRGTRGYRGGYWVLEGRLEVLHGVLKGHTRVRTARAALGELFWGALAVL